MEIILLETIENVGGLGDRVKVKPGYARNFLVPQGKALPATEANVLVFEGRRAELEKVQADELAAAQARARGIEAVSLRIERKVGDGRLFGSVTAADIADALTAQGETVARSEVRLPEGPIRQTGRYEIRVHVHPDVDAVVAVAVVSDDAEDVASEALEAEAAASGEEPLDGAIGDEDATGEAVA